MDKKISVIVPVYNTEDYVERCIRSIMNQTYTNLEIIIVNDGSIDTSLSICEKLQKEDNRIIIVNQDNKGVSKARNVGLDKATGEFVGFVDSDDFLEPDMYEIMINHLIVENADLCRIKAYIYNREGGIEEISKERNVFIYNNELEIMNAYLKNELKIAVWDKLFRRKCIEKLRFDYKLFNEDAAYVWEACLNSRKVVMDTKQLYHHIKRATNSLTSCPFNENNLTLYNYCKKNFNKLLNEYLDKEEQAYLFYFNGLFHLLKVYKRDWDNNNLTNYYKKEILGIIDELNFILKNKSQYINKFDLIHSKDIIEILANRLNQLN